jgi:hygromycin-B 4-O-kinase
VSVHNLSFIEGGEGSQAFSYSLDNKDYIIRANRRNYSFLKDRYAAEHFKSPIIPIPIILEIGNIDDQHYYAISEKVVGKKVDAFSEEEMISLRPKLLETLDAIHQTDVSSTTGYGAWNAEGKGSFDTWATGLRDINEGSDIFETTFLEKDFWNKIYSEITKLTQFCPEDRHLIHGDYGFDNVLSNGKEITGVIDWGEAKYGDFLYDYAWLSYWSKNNMYRAILKQYYLEKGVNIHNFDERMKCYELHIGLGALAFYATSEQKEKYDSNKNRLLRVI